MWCNGVRTFIRGVPFLKCPLIRESTVVAVVVVVVVIVVLVCFLCRM